LALNPGLDDARKMLEDSIPRISSLPSQHATGTSEDNGPVVRPLQPVVER
jgi:hypothetical protein